MVPFVAKQIGINRGFGPCKTGAVLTKDGRLAAGLVFHNWSPEAAVIEVSAAAINPAWAQRSVLQEAFGYVFGGAGCQMAVARCVESNHSVRRLWKAFGATEFIIPRLRGRHEAECIQSLTDDAWIASRLAR